MRGRQLAYANSPGAPWYCADLIYNCGRGRPAHRTATRSGGRTRGELDSGITTTVLRRSFTTVADMMTHGLVLAISEPNVGSKRTHQTSPRRSIVPWLGDNVSQCVPLAFDCEDFRVGIRNIARADQTFIAILKLLDNGLGNILRAISRGNPAKQLLGDLLR